MLFPWKKCPIHFDYLQSSTAASVSLNLAHNVVALAEEGVPLVEDRLLLVRKILPVRAAVLGLERGLGKSAVRLLAGEDCGEKSGALGLWDLLHQNGDLQGCVCGLAFRIRRLIEQEIAVHSPLYWPVGPYASFLETSNTVPCSSRISVGGRQSRLEAYLDGDERGIALVSACKGASV